MSKITNEMLGDVDSMILDTIEEDICLVGLGDTNIYTKRRKFCSCPDNKTDGLEISVQGGVEKDNDSLIAYVRMEDEYYYSAHNPNYEKAIIQAIIQNEINSIEDVTGIHGVITGENAILAYADSLEYLAKTLREGVANTHK